MDQRFESEAKLLGKVLENGSSTEAAEALSAALLPKNHADYRSFLDAVQKSSSSQGNNDLDLSRNTVHLWAQKPGDQSYVILTPGQNLTSICKFEMGHAASQHEIKSCISIYSDVNSLKDPNYLQAGKVLKVPTEEDWQGQG
jgi:hypothetical protein